MPNFRQADKQAFTLVESLIEDHYEELRDAEVKIGILFAYPTSGAGPCLKNAGHAVAAKVRVVSHKDRVAGLEDAQILVDGNAWEGWSEERRAAVLDGRLCALEVLKDDEGVVLEDDCSRPRLKVKPHDFVLEGFAEIAERYGEESLEVSTARAITDEFGQMLFPWVTLEG